MTLPESPLGSQFIIPPSAMIAEPLGLQRQPLGFLQRRPLGEFTPPVHSAKSPQLIRRSEHNTYHLTPFATLPDTFALNPPCLGQVIQAKLMDHPLLRSPQLRQQILPQVSTQDPPSAPSPDLQSRALPLSRFTLPPGFTFPSPSPTNAPTHKSIQAKGRLGEFNPVEPENLPENLPDSPALFSQDEAQLFDPIPHINRSDQTEASSEQPDINGRSHDSAHDGFNNEPEEIRAKHRPVDTPPSINRTIESSDAEDSAIRPVENAPSAINTAPNAPTVQPSIQPSEQNTLDDREDQSGPRTSNPTPQHFTRPLLSPAPIPTPIEPAIQPSRSQSPNAPTPTPTPTLQRPNAPTPTPTPQLLNAPTPTPTPQRLNASTPQRPNVPTSQLQLPGLQRQLPTVPFPFHPMPGTIANTEGETDFNANINADLGAITDPIQTQPIIPTQQTVPDAPHLSLNPPALPNISPSIDPAIGSLQVFHPKVAFSPNLQRDEGEALMPIPKAITEPHALTSPEAFLRAESLTPDPIFSPFSPALEGDTLDPDLPTIPSPQQVSDLKNADLPAQRRLEPTFAPFRETVSVQGNLMVQQQPSPELNDSTAVDFESVEQSNGVDIAHVQPQLDLPLTESHAPDDSIFDEDRADPINDVTVPLPSNRLPPSDHARLQRAPIQQPLTPAALPALDDSPTPSNLEKTVQQQPTPLFPQDRTTAPNRRDSPLPPSIPPITQPETSPSLSPPVSPVEQTAPLKAVHPTTIHPKTNTLSPTPKGQRLQPSVLHRSADPLVYRHPTPVMQRSSKGQPDQQQPSLNPLGQWHALHTWHAQLIQKHALEQPQKSESGVGLPERSPYRPVIQPQNAFRLPPTTPPIPPSSPVQALEAFLPDAPDSSDSTTVQAKIVSPQNIAPPTLLPDTSPPANATPVDIAPKNWSSLEDLLAQTPPPIQAKEAWESQFPLLSTLDHQSSHQSAKPQAQKNAPEMISAKLDLNALIPDTLSDPSRPLDSLETAITGHPTSNIDDDVGPDTALESRVESVPSPASTPDAEPDHDTLELLAHTLYQTMRSRLSTSQSHHHRLIYAPLPWTSAIHLPSPQAKSGTTSSPRASPACPSSRAMEDLLWYVHDSLTHRLRRDRDRHGPS